MMRYIFAGLSILIAGAVFFSYTKPAYDGVQAAHEQSMQYDIALQKAAELQALKQTLLQRYNSFNPNELDHLQKLLPDHVDNVALILDLDNLAARFSMPIQNVDVSTPASSVTNKVGIAAPGSVNQKFDSVTIRFTTRGTYDDFMTFLKSLEASLRIVDLVSLHLTPEAFSRGPGIQPSYIYEITLRTYWLK